MKACLNCKHWTANEQIPLPEIPRPRPRRWWELGPPDYPHHSDIIRYDNRVVYNKSGDCARFKNPVQTRREYVCEGFDPIYADKPPAA